MDLNSDSNRCQVGESIDKTKQWSLRPHRLSMPPRLAPQFFIGCESPKDAWVNKLIGQRKKILVTNMVKEEFKDIELNDGGGLNFMVTPDTQTSRKIFPYAHRYQFFLTFGFKDVLFSR